jgi:hypothetical protein
LDGTILDCALCTAFDAVSFVFHDTVSFSAILGQAECRLPRQPRPPGQKDTPKRQTCQKPG